MTAISAPSKVLVTGVNGFVAIWIVKYLLDNGYSVRGTTRSANSAEHLKALFAEFIRNNKLELVLVSDFLKVRSMCYQHANINMK